MTVGSCVNYCAGLGLPLAGVEYGTQVSLQLEAVDPITTLTCIWFCFPVLRAFKTFSQPPAQLKLMKTSSTVRQQASKRCDEHGDRLFGPVQRQVLGSQHGELWRREQAHALRQPRLRLDRSHPSLWMGLLVVHDGGLQRPCAFGRYDLQRLDVSRDVRQLLQRRRVRLRRTRVRTGEFSWSSTSSTPRTDPYCPLVLRRSVGVAIPLVLERSPPLRLSAP